MNSPIARLKSAVPNMPPAAKRLATVILDRPEAVVEMSIADLAKTAQVSEGSVIGLCQQLGAKGFPELKIAIARELGSSRELLHEDIVRADDSVSVIAKIAASHRTAIDDTVKVLDPAVVDKAVTILKNARRIELYGVGTAAPIAEDAAYRFLRLGLDARAMTDPHSQAVSAAFTGSHVATITISHSGRTRETLAATRIAQEAGARTICITNFGKPPLLKYCEVALFTAAVETRYRMEAMASRVAQLVVIDTLYARLALERWEPSLAAIERSYAILSEKRLKSGSEDR
ncbi:MurR/RpiR family transcriptional regulator [Undibacter mobilis]|uniref:MurR/RpiR family transcriptional regulator n=1 Tax=Undibacter mobilis TaxID=2292256 RepID=A0A371B8G8_9BRAD|nr:MurR/RpiR family transcriptional regulator [Undibacter mobilis]RDV03817.1 MurR/RpiR family transcriptional regulator [Undibacter mobilis]